MAEVLELGDMLSKLVEPKRQFRWVAAIDGIDAFTLKTATRPQLAFEDTVIDYINTRFYYPGKATYEPISLTTLDPLVPSAAQKWTEWMRLVYEANTGRMGYKAFLTKTWNLRLLDPVGAVAEEWEIVNAWPQSVNFGELDYSVSDAAVITATIRYDFANLLF